MKTENLEVDCYNLPVHTYPLKKLYNVLFGQCYLMLLFSFNFSVTLFFSLSTYSTL